MLLVHDYFMFQLKTISDDDKDIYIYFFLVEGLSGYTRLFIAIQILLGNLYKDLLMLTSLQIKLLLYLPSPFRNLC